MSKWIQRRGEIIQPKGRVPQGLLEVDNPTPKFTKKRPIIKPSPAGMPSMYDTYLNNSSAVLDESVPVHLRYSKHCGYDDFHKAFRSMGDKFPQLTFPHYGPPSSYEHVY
ncbi:zinc finger SWIM domain-containing protein 6 [Elysia marginata]|uniref:Zinc finger SWIM domain-containing protein 6 n=1 Tax=Elysia marginata TaxID=1093978 RepID=A0AAV4IE79_9GAST|nr:zinc finger SWIM domain-containing protein 6 [Elysia marginata]